MNSDQLTTVLKWPLLQIEDWFRARSASETVGDKDFNWRLFASTAGSKAQKEESLRWARLSLESYAALAAREPSPDTADDLIHSAMILRVWLIGRMGVRGDDPVLNPGLVLNWFETWLQTWLQQSAFTTFEEVARFITASDWRSHPFEQLPRLRRLKCKLIVMEQLVKTGTVRADAGLEGWMRLRPRLP